MCRSHAAEVRTVMLGRPARSGPVRRDRRTGRFRRVAAPVHGALDARAVPGLEIAL